MNRKYLNYIFQLILLGVFSSCSLTRYVPEGQYLVQKVSIHTQDEKVKGANYEPYLKQVPPHKTFGLIPFPLYLYNWSGRDSSRWVNRFLRRAGTAPELYDSLLTQRTEREIQKALVNQGYMGARVTSETQLKNKKASVTYLISAHEPKTIGKFSTHILNPAVAALVEQQASHSSLQVGMKLDRNQMEEERVRITKVLRNAGYWGFHKNLINYRADTTRFHNRVKLQLNVVEDPAQPLVPYKIGKVYFSANADEGLEEGATTSPVDTVEFNGYYFLTQGKHYLRERTMIENCYLYPGGDYSDRAVESTYRAFSRLQILKHVNVRFEQSPTRPDVVDCYVMLVLSHNQNIQTDLEGTNSDGDFGFAASATYQHYNLFRGSETFSVKVRGAYENISGWVDNNFRELGMETSLTFPEFLFPMLSLETRRRLRASTSFTASYSYQHRPEYTRVIAGGGWKYLWQDNQTRSRHTFDFVDINYVYLPYRSEAFIDSVINQNPITYASYKDHLIMRSGYSFYKSNFNPAFRKRDYYTLRVNTELAGNTLSAIARLAKLKKENGDYTLFGLRFEQYWKLDANYAYTKVFTPKNSIAFRVAAGVGVPYGNSEVLPFEKRYYAGGANSVRGWSVRTLGPGIYHSTNGDLDYFNQSGDIRFDASVEYRTRLFWKLEMAAFVDAGNVWTLKDYASQEGGKFEWDEFYRQIALAWGVGMRFDFDFFLIRLDLGFKAYDPAALTQNKYGAQLDPWRVKSPFGKGNQTLHFAVGYPF